MTDGQHATPPKRFGFREVNCDLCGSSSNRVVLRKRGVLIPSLFNLVRCNECGLVFVNPRIRDEDIAKLYDDDYYAGRGFDRSVNYTNESEPWYLSAVAETLASLSGGVLGKSCLDVGCGNGSLVRRLGAAGALAYGSETAPAARAICEARGIPLLDLDAGALEFNDRFDIITAAEVIEHVPSPTAFLTSIAAFAKPGGLIFLTTGNWALESKLPGTAYVMPDGHLNYFTPVTLAKLFKKVGLSPVFEPLNRTWFPFRLLAPHSGKTPLGFVEGLGRLARRVAPQFGPFPLATKPASK